MGGVMQHWITVMEYDLDGVRYREESRINLTCSAPQNKGNMNTWYWSMYPMYFVAAPVDKFERLKPELMAVGSTLRPTAKWWVQSQTLLRELAQQRIKDFSKAIAERARQYNQISDAQMAAWRKEMKAGDAAQHEFVNNYLYERDDYQDTNGSIVNLPMHYSHVFSNGSGGYVLTNNSLDKPGEGWTEIEVAK